MYEETIERLTRTKDAYKQLASQAQVLINAIEGAIAQVDLTVSQHREAAGLSGIAFNVRGGMAGGGTEIGAADQRLVTMLANVRSMLSSAKLTAEQAPAIATGQVSAVNAFIGKLQR